MGFYLQRAVGGPVLSLDFWRAFAAIPNLVAIKIAPFDRYRTLDVVRAVVESGRHEEIALYTGNDDAIVADLLTSFDFDGPTGLATTRIVGGLLGQWAVWTHSAVQLFAEIRAARAGKPEALPDLLVRSAAWTDANAALFDARHKFAGSIAGVHEVLRRQGLLAGTWCLNPAERLSPGQAAELDRVARTHPWLADDDFVSAHRDEWLR
jgi:dihydrodipicolinate synthase/N-acetylneuraminate lyase